MKLIVNMVMGIVVVGLVEVMVMVEKVGLDQEDVVEVFLVGVFSCLIVIYKSQGKLYGWGVFFVVFNKG